MHGNGQAGATHPWLDASRAPLYVLTYPATREPGDLVAAHQAVEAVYQRTTSTVGWIVDARAVNTATARERQLAAQHQKQVAALAARYCAGMAIVTHSSLVRGLFTAINWMAPVPYPFEMCASMAEAEAWIGARLSCTK